MTYSVSGLAFKPDFGAKWNLNVKYLGNISRAYRGEEVFVSSPFKQYFVKMVYVGIFTAYTSLNLQPLCSWVQLIKEVKPYQIAATDNQNQFL